MGIAIMLLLQSLLLLLRVLSSILQYYTLAYFPSVLVLIL